MNMENAEPKYGERDEPTLFPIDLPSTILVLRPTASGVCTEEVGSSIESPRRGWEVKGNACSCFCTLF